MVQAQLEVDRPARHRTDWVASCHDGHVQAWRLQGIERVIRPRGVRTTWAPRQCRFCGLPVIAACQQCSERIAARRSHTRSADWQLDRFCAACGHAYPWSVPEPPARSSVRRRSRALMRLGQLLAHGTWRVLGLEALIKDLIRRLLGLPPA